MIRHESSSSRDCKEDVTHVKVIETETFTVGKFIQKKCILSERKRRATK